VEGGEGNTVSEVGGTNQHRTKVFGEALVLRGSLGDGQRHASRKGSVIKVAKRGWPDGNRAGKKPKKEL